jgi:hypothetical protein
LTPEGVKAIQAEVDHEWAILMEKISSSKKPRRKIAHRE